MLMNNLDKETSKHIILCNIDIIDKLVTRPRGDEEAYHHANFVLTNKSFLLFWHMPTMQRFIRLLIRSLKDTTSSHSG